LGFDCCSRSGDVANQNAAQAAKPPTEPEDDHSDEESDEEDLDTVPKTLAPGNLKELNDEKDAVNTKLLEAKDKVRELRKAGDAAALEAAKDEELTLRNECMDLERKIGAIEEHSKNRANAGASCTYTWQQRGTLGLRLQDTKDSGVVVSFVAKDANFDMPDLTGYSVTRVHDDSTAGKSVNEVVAMIQESKWPLQMTFEEGAKKIMDTDGDGIVDEEEMAKYMNEHAASAAVAS